MSSREKPTRYQIRAQRPTQTNRTIERSRSPRPMGWACSLMPTAQFAATKGTILDS